MLYNECLLNEREIYIMKKDEMNKVLEFNKFMKKFDSFLKHPIVAAVVALILWNVSILIINIPADNNNKVNDLKVIQTELAGLSESVDGLDIKYNDVIERLTRMEAKSEFYGNDIDKLDDKLFNLLTLNQNGINALISPNEKNLVGSSIESSVIIATDEKGKEFRAGELINRTIFLTYNDNGLDSYFIGKYNENFHWDGECLSHSYDGDRLEGIMESVYNDGNLISYKQVIPYENNGKTWYVSEKVSSNGVNFGNTYIYERKEDYLRDFSINNAAIEDILTYEDFVKTIDTPVIGFYHGNASEGWFNDDTGEAYRVSYMKDGTVNWLYHGKFKDGERIDNSGNAYIIKYDNGSYKYYKGVCKGDELNDNSIYDSITVEEIENLIYNDEFECELKWNNN